MRHYSTSSLIHSLKVNGTLKHWQDFTENDVRHILLSQKITPKQDNVCDIQLALKINPLIKLNSRLY